MEAGPIKKKVRLSVDLQCGSCGTLYHQGENPPKFCSCCGAAYDRYCIRCQRRVEMYFEEWWPEDDMCVRTYSPAKRCPACNAGLEGSEREELQPDSVYEH
ncbi:hypothetical protein ACFL2T_07765 [Elusimicrobiota bacterium]